MYHSFRPVLIILRIATPVCWYYYYVPQHRRVRASPRAPRALVTRGFFVSGFFAGFHVQRF